jgi:hypothetical protein
VCSRTPRAVRPAYVSTHRRERQQREEEELAREYIWASGDEALLERITNQSVAEKARTTRARLPPRQAGDRPGANVPQDLRREAQAELAALAQQKLAAAR